MKYYLLLLLFLIASCSNFSRHVNYSKSVNESINMIERDNAQNALVILSSAIIKCPDSARAYKYRGYCYYLLNNFDNALTDLKKALVIDSNDKEVHLYKYKVDLRMADYEAQLIDLSNVIRIDPNNILALNSRGLLFYDFDKYELT